MSEHNTQQLNEELPHEQLEKPLKFIRSGAQFSTAVNIFNRAQQVAGKIWHKENESRDGEIMRDFFFFRLKSKEPTVIALRSSKALRTLTDVVEETSTTIFARWIAHGCEKQSRKNNRKSDIESEGLDE